MSPDTVKPIYLESKSGMSTKSLREEEAQRKAQALLDKDKQRDADAAKERDQAREKEAAKTARLRALRLAKESADKEAAATRSGAPKRRHRR